MIRNAIVLGALLLALAGCEGAFDDLFPPGGDKGAQLATAAMPAASATADTLPPEEAPPAPLPKRKPPLRHDEIRELQSALQRFGYDPGPIDGLVGPRTFGAVRAYQTATGLPVDGRITYALLLRLRDQVRFANAAEDARRDAQTARGAEPAAGGTQQRGIFSRIFGPLFGE